MKATSQRNFSLLEQFGQVDHIVRLRIKPILGREEILIKEFIAQLVDIKIDIERFVFCSRHINPVLKIHPIAVVIDGNGSRATGKPPLRVIVIGIVQGHFANVWIALELPGFEINTSADSSL